MRRGGTATPAPLDVGRMGEMLRQAGIDPRHWLSYGTVGIVKDDGTFDPTDPHAIYVQSSGVSVDVLLHPMNQPVTCRYSGQQGGSASSIYCPIRPGDEVLVGIPDGDMRMPATILLVMNADHSRLPLGDDLKPLWQNDRVLVHSAGTPIQARATDGTNQAELLVRPDGTLQVTGPAGVTLGQPDATEPVVLGQTYRQNEDQMLTDWSALMQVAAAACHAAVSPATALTALQAVATMLDGMVGDISTFQGQAAQYLSQVVKTR